MQMFMVPVYVYAETPDAAVKHVRGHLPDDVVGAARLRQRRR